MNDWSSPWAAASNGSNRSTPRVELENPFALTGSTLAPPDPAFLHKTSLHKPHDSVWSTFTNDESVWSEALGVGTEGVRDGTWTSPAPIVHNLDVGPPEIREEEQDPTYQLTESEAQEQSEVRVTLSQSDVEEEVHPSLDYSSMEPELESEPEEAESLDSDEFDDFQGTQEASFVADEVNVRQEVTKNALPPTPTSEPDDRGAKSLESADHAEAPKDDTEEASEVTSDPPKHTQRVEDAYKFTFDETLYDKLFPNTTAGAETQTQTQTQIQATEDREMDDNIISSTSERKAWYRISREGTMREHENGSADYIRVVWRGSAVQLKATKIVEKWIQEYRSNVGSTLFSTAMKSGAAFNWSDNTESSHSRKPSISQIKTHHKKPSTQSSTAPSTATARSSMHSDRGFGLGFSWSSDKPSLQDTPTPPSSAGVGKSPSTEFKSFKFGLAREEERMVKEIPMAPTPTEELVPDAEDDFGEFEEFTGCTDTIHELPADQTRDVEDNNLSPEGVRASELCSPVTNGTPHQTPPETSWPVLRPSTDLRRSLETPPRSAKTVTFDQVELQPQHPFASNINEMSSTDPWSGLESLDQRNPTTKLDYTQKPFQHLDQVPALTSPSTQHANTVDISAAEIIHNLPNLAFMLR